MIAPKVDGFVPHTQNVNLRTVCQAARVIAMRTRNLLGQHRLPRHPQLNAFTALKKSSPLNEVSNPVQEVSKPLRGIHASGPLRTLNSNLELLQSTLLSLTKTGTLDSPILLDFNVDSTKLAKQGGCFLTEDKRLQVLFWADLFFLMQHFKLYRNWTFYNILVGSKPL